MYGFAVDWFKLSASAFILLNFYMLSEIFTQVSEINLHVKYLAKQESLKNKEEKE